MSQATQRLNDIVVLGGGAIGSVLATFLQRAASRRAVPDDCTIHLIGRERVMDHVSRTGITYVPHGVTDPAQCLHAKGISTHTSAREVVRADVLFVSVKAYGLRQALQEASHLLASNPWVVVAMNGLGLREIVAEYVADERIVETIVNYPTMLEVSEQEVRAINSGGNANLVLEDGLFAQTVLPTLFDQAEFDAHTVPDFRLGQWQKAMANIGMNAISAMAQLTVGEVLDRAPLRAVVEKLIREAVAVAEHEGIAFGQDMVAFFYQFASHDPHHHTSMYWDLQRGRPTEVDFMNGYVVRRGEQYAIDTPANRAVCEMMQVIEAAQPRPR